MSVLHTKYMGKDVTASLTQRRTCRSGPRVACDLCSLNESYLRPSAFSSLLAPTDALTMEYEKTSFSTVGGVEPHALTRSLQRRR